MNYSYPIEMAFFVFPFIAFFMTIPYIIIQYRKYGSVSKIRSVIIFSFIFYLLCAYFLVILPLPSISEVSKYTGRYYNLTPFVFVKEIISNSEFSVSNVKSIIYIFNSSKIMEPAFNVLLLIPFGIYLRYYFRFDAIKCITFSFFLSLFFELTQLSGLYFIYPRPYRLFDVNDLINNTFGGALGFLITPLFQLFLPSREKIDIKSYEVGKKVSYLRRFIAFSIDILLIFLVSIVFSKIIDFDFSLSFLIINSLYFLFVPCLSNGYTFGKWFVKIRIENVSEQKFSISFKTCLGKFVIFYCLIINNFLIVHEICNICSFGYLIQFTGYVICFFIYFIFSFNIIISYFKSKRLFYEDLLGICNSSVVFRIEDEEASGSDDDEI